jgi:hypothetical protein
VLVRGVLAVGSAEVCGRGFAEAATYASRATATHARTARQTQMSTQQAIAPSPSSFDELEKEEELNRSELEDTATAAPESP